MLTLFCWFFPLQLFMEHVMELNGRQPGPPKDRHLIPWNKGVFLRFLGILIRAATHPLPNLTMHWRWPSNLPRPEGWKSCKGWMTETVFLRYWRFACIPGVYGGVEDKEIGLEGRTATYQALKGLL